MPIDNPSFETVGATQGSADGWTATIVGAATGTAAIEDGAGLLFGWEGFGGWVAGQAEYRFDGFEVGDTTAGTVEDFGIWLSADQTEAYRAAFSDSDTVDGTIETFGAWQSGQDDYRAAFEPGDLTAGTVEDFGTWAADQAEYRAAFEPGDTATGLFKTGPSTTAAFEPFGDCRSDADIEATAASVTISAPGHNFELLDPVLLESVGTLFAPFKRGVTYYVRNPVEGVSLELSATSGGAAITATDIGDGTHTLTGDPRFFWRNPRTAW